MSDVPDDHEVDEMHAVAAMSDVDVMEAFLGAQPECQDYFAALDRRALEKLALEAKARASEATVGPWGHKAGMLKHYVFSNDEREDFGFSQQIFHWEDGHEVPAEANCVFVAHARTDVPALADAVLRLLGENRRLRSAVMVAKREATAGAVAIDPGFGVSVPDCGDRMPAIYVDRADCDPGFGVEAPGTGDACVLVRDIEPSVGDVDGYGASATEGDDDDIPPPPRTPHWSPFLAREYIEVLKDGMSRAANDLSEDIERLERVNDEYLSHPALMRAFVRGASGIDLAFDETLIFFYAICLGNEEVFDELTRKHTALERALSNPEADWKPHQRAWLMVQEAFLARPDLKELERIAEAGPGAAVPTAG